jgi:hypothetical protein
MEVNFIVFTFKLKLVAEFVMSCIWGVTELMLPDWRQFSAATKATKKTIAENPFAVSKPMETRFHMQISAVTINTESDF